MTMTRRTVLTAALSAGAAFTLAGPAAAAPGAVPQTLAALDPANIRFPIGYLGLTWTGDQPPTSVRFRTVSGWGAWQPVPHGDSHGVLIPAGGALSYELRGDGVRAIAINTTDGSPVQPYAASGGGLSIPGVRYLSRAAWGADESLRFGPDGTELFPPAYFPVQTLTVHHTVTDGTDPAAVVRAIYFFHTVTQNFGDIGYHLLIDQAGTVYEGRWSGTDPIPVFQGARTGDGTPRMSNGAHTGGFNAGNVGVALLGDLTSVQPTAAARRSLIAVLATLAKLTRRDPLGTVAYVNPISGATKTVNTISGHRDWLATECPGEAFYPALPGIRQAVAALVGR
ncbi:MAG: peptidoglycan recognition family protein [Kibdelosporangium sp.]